MKNKMELVFTSLLTLAFITAFASAFVAYADNDYQNANFWLLVSILWMIPGAISHYKKD
jgi:hypothetical protein